MKTKQLAMLLLSCCCFTACVDDKYDFSDVETDDVVVGDSWIAPLGSGSISTKDVVNIEKVPSIRIVNDTYVMVYEGQMNIETNNMRAASSEMMKIGSELVNTGDMNGLFEDDFNLMLADPHVKLMTDMTGTSLDCNLGIEARSAKGTINSSSDFTLSSAQPKLWVGPIDPKTSEYMFVKNEQLPKMVSILPEQLLLTLSADVNQWLENPSGVLSTVGYAVEIPLSPAPEFRAISVERVEDVFDADFVDYVFDAGEAIIYGEVENQMPFDLAIEMILVDYNNNPIDIKFPLQEVKGASGKVEFKITEQDMPKMETARHIDMKLRLSGREQAEALKEGQEVKINLKLKKNGGIAI